MDVESTSHPPATGRPVSGRYWEATRRVSLGRTAAVGALTLLPGLACGNDDAAVFDRGASTSIASDASTDSALSDSALSDSALSDSALSDSAAPSTTGAATSGSGVDSTVDGSSAGATSDETPTAAFPTGGELVVSFSFSPSSSGGRIHNPYVAVWAEDTEGNLVDTISLWYEQSSKGARWLDDLRSWYEVAGSDISTVSSGATRAAGDYSVVWDGTDVDGNPVAQGDYVLYVEAAREHGPYEITSAAITVSDSGGSWTLDDADELTGLSAQLVV
jgi:hypothetical protein